MQRRHYFEFVTTIQTKRPGQYFVIVFRFSL